MPTQSDYKQQLFNLLPKGLAWSRQEGTNLSNLLDGVSAELARVDTRALELPAQVNPATTSELLDEWVNVTAIFDSCSDITNATAEKRAAVLSKLASRGGSSHAYFKRIADALGVDIHITDKFEPARAGYAHAGDPCIGTGWVFSWQVRGPETTAKYARAGYAVAGEPIVIYGNELLECTINRLKPAHTNVFFVYFDVYKYLGAIANCTAVSTGALKVTRHLASSVTGTCTANHRELWTPYFILNDLGMWLDSTDTTTLNKTGDALNSWADKSNFGNDALTEGSAQPSHGVDTINGLPLVSFDGTNDYMKVLDDPNIDLTPELDIFIYRKARTAAYNFRPILKKRKYSLFQFGNTANTRVLGDAKEWTGIGLTGVDYYLSGTVRCLAYSSTLAGQSSPRWYAGANSDIWEYRQGNKWESLGTGLGLTIVPSMAIYSDFLYACDEGGKIWKWSGAQWFLSADIGAVGTTPTKLFVYNGGLYCTCQGSDDLWKISSRNGTSADAWTSVGSVGGTPIDMCTHDGYLWIACKTGNSVYQYDGTTLTAHTDGDLVKPLVLCSHGTGLYCIANGDQTATKYLVRWTGSGTSWTPATIPGVNTTDGLNDMASYDGKLWITRRASGISNLLVYNNDGSAIDAGNFTTQVDLLSKIPTSQDVYRLDTLNGELWAGMLNVSPYGVIALTNEIHTVVGTNESGTEILETIATNGQLGLRVNGVETIGTFYTAKDHANTHNVDHEIVESFAYDSGLITGWSTDTLTINPTNNLPASSELAVMVDYTVVQDLSGNQYSGINDNATWSFTTGT